MLRIVYIFVSKMEYWVIGVIVTISFFAYHMYSVKESYGGMSSRQSARDNSINNVLNSMLAETYP